MILRLSLCAAAVLGLAAPALAQPDSATALNGFYTDALTTEQKASALVDASTKSFDAHDNATGCASMREARRTFGLSHSAMEGMREVLTSAKDLAPDYQKQGLDWLNTNEPVVESDMKQADEVLADCDRPSGPAYSTAGIDQYLDAATAVMARGLAANRDARGYFENDDVDRACDAMEVARQNLSEGYQDISEARDRVQSNHDLPASVQRQYFDTIDNVQRNADGLATTMADLWRNRCSWREKH